MAWGRNESGQLGKGKTSSSGFKVFTWQKHNIQVAHMALGSSFSALLADTGKVYYCGNLGAGNKSSPVILETLMQTPPVISQIAAGTDHIVALTNKGVVLTAGRNRNGCLGNGSSAATFVSKLTPLGSGAFGDGVKGIWVAGGPDHTVIVGSDSAVYSWGGKGPQQSKAAQALVPTKLEFKQLDPKLKFQCVCAGNQSTYLISSRTQLSTPSRPLSIPVRLPNPAYPTFSYLEGAPEQYYAGATSGLRERSSNPCS